jgi:hypothetical protein
VPSFNLRRGEDGKEKKVGQCGTKRVEDHFQNQNQVWEEDVVHMKEKNECQACTKKHPSSSSYWRFLTLKICALYKKLIEIIAHHQRFVDYRSKP